MVKVNSRRVNSTLGNEETAIKNYRCLKNVLRIAAKVHGITFEEILNYVTRDPDNNNSSLNVGSFNSYCRTGRVSAYSSNLFFEIFDEELSKDFFTGNSLLDFETSRVMLVKMMEIADGVGQEFNPSFTSFTYNLDDFEDIDMQGKINAALENYFLAREERLGDGLINPDDPNSEQTTNCFMDDNEIEYIANEVEEVLSPYKTILGDDDEETDEVDGIADDIVSDEAESKYLPSEFLKFLKESIAKVNTNKFVEEGTPLIDQVLESLSEHQKLFDSLRTIAEIREKTVTTQ